MIDFNDVDVDDDSGVYSDAQIEAAEFLGKMDWEGGIDGLWMYGGEDVFPEELRPLAAAYGAAMERLSEAVTLWAADRGVRY